MIPNRMLRHDFSAGGIKDRVTACRKRLRVNRLLVKVHASTIVEEVFTEARMNYSSFEDNELGGNGALLQTEGQEVGIT